MVKFVSLVSGSSGNSTFISDGRTKILVDCGMSGKALEKSLNDIGEKATDISAILVTHEHIDHVKGVGIISRRYNIPIYASMGTHNAMDIGKVADENRCIVGDSFEIGNIGIKCFDIPHDAAQPFGYSFFLDGEKISVATDIGHITDDIIQAVKGSNRILLESNHDVDMLKMGTYPYQLKQRILGENGHLSNDTAAEIAAVLANSGTKSIMLGHLSDENNYPQIAYNTVMNRLRADKIDIALCVADRFNPTPCLVK